VGLKEGAPLKVTSLSIADYLIDPRHGLAFWAAKVEPLSMRGYAGGVA
jgi:hypothetical protein